MTFVFCRFHKIIELVKKKRAAVTGQVFHEPFYMPLLSTSIYAEQTIAIISLMVWASVRGQNLASAVCLRTVTTGGAGVYTMPSVEIYSRCCKVHNKAVDG